MFTSYGDNVGDYDEHKLESGEEAFNGSSDLLRSAGAESGLTDFGAPPEFQSFGAPEGGTPPVTRAIAVEHFQQEDNFGSNWWGPDMPETDFGPSDGLAGLSIGPPPSLKKLDHGLPELLVTSVTSFPSKLPPSTLTAPTLNPFGSQSHPRPLKPVPAYIVKYSSFYSSSSHTEILSAIDGIFTEADDLDHEFLYNKNKIQGVCRGPTGGAARFVVKVYQSEGSEILVEMQKREGCVVSFNQCYNRTLNKLSVHVSRRASSPKASDCEPTFNTLPSSTPKHSQLDDCAMDDSECEQLMNDCLAMANGSITDLKRDALSALAAMEVPACIAAGQLGLLMSLLSSVLTSADDEVRENACLLLLSLCGEEGLRSQIVERLLATIFSVLDQPGCLENRSSKRHIARAVSLLSQSHAQAIRNAKGSEQYIRTLRMYKDSRDDASLASHAGAALSQIAGMS